MVHSKRFRRTEDVSSMALVLTSGSWAYTIRSTYDPLFLSPNRSGESHSFSHSLLARLISALPRRSRGTF
jgi:hypothetical protein